jgi:LysR family transcriptional regulator, glycine cleavage system transcriptional activator
MKLPPVNALRAFEAAARLSSISRAGDELSVTHAAVSHHIRHLEQWLGTELFRKEGRNVALTAEGTALSATLTDSFRAMEVQCRSIRRGRRAGSLTIACIPSIASRWLIPLLPEFQSAHPSLELRVIYARASDRLAGLDADVLITLSAGDEPGTQSRQLLSRVNRPVASPHYLARRGALQSAEAIAGADLLHDEDPANWAAWFRKAGLFPLPALRGPVFQDFNLLATALIAGHGVALCPTEVFAREIAAGDLVVLSDTSTQEDENYHLIMPRNGRAPSHDFATWFAGKLGA